MDKKIYLDFDDCTYNCLPSISRIALEEFGLEISENDTSWNLGLERGVIESIFANPKMYIQKDIMDGCIEALKYAKAKGYEIILFSKCSPWNAVWKLEFCEQFLSDVIDDFILVGLTVDKASFDMSDGIMIEDSPNNFGNAKHKILCQCAGVRDWNRDYECFNKMKHWSEFKKILRNIEMFDNLIKSL